MSEQVAADAARTSGPAPPRAASRPRTTRAWRSRPAPPASWCAGASSATAGRWPARSSWSSPWCWPSPPSGSARSRGGGACPTARPAPAASSTAARPPWTSSPGWTGTGSPGGATRFGQDNIGIDYFSLVMRGTQRSLIIAFVVGIVSTIVGTVIGAIAGFYRGFVDAILMRLTDVFIIMPVLLVAAVLGRRFGNLGIWVLAVVLGLLVWTSAGARAARGVPLPAREGVRRGRPRRRRLRRGASSSSTSCPTAWA